MCLYIDATKTEQAKVREENWVIRYKVVRFFKDEITSWYFSGYKWQIGWNLAQSQLCIKRTVQLNPVMDPTEVLVVDEGIHVYVSKEYAKQVLKECEDSYDKYGVPILIEVKCYKEDFFASGKDFFASITPYNVESEVYTRVYLEKLPEKTTILLWLKQRICRKEYESSCA